MKKTYALTTLLVIFLLFLSQAVCAVPVPYASEVTGFEPEIECLKILEISGFKNFCDEDLYFYNRDNQIDYGYKVEGSKSTMISENRSSMDISYHGDHFLMSDGQEYFLSDFEDDLERADIENKIIIRNWKVKARLGNQDLWILGQTDFHPTVTTKVRPILTFIFVPLAFLLFNWWLIIVFLVLLFFYYRKKNRMTKMVKTEQDRPAINKIVNFFKKIKLPIIIGSIILLLFYGIFLVIIKIIDVPTIGLGIFSFVIALLGLLYLVLILTSIILRLVSRDVFNKLFLSGFIIWNYSLFVFLMSMFAIRSW